MSHSYYQRRSGIFAPELRTKLAEQGDNLWPDGYLMSRSLAAFSSPQPISFDPISPVGRGSILTSTANTLVYGTIISVDTYAKYEFSVWAQGNGVESMYVGLTCLDIDWRTINVYEVSQSRYGTSALTTLAAPLNPGATTATLTSAANWAGAAQQYYERGLVWFPYVNSLGYAYPDYTYAGTNTAFEHHGGTNYGYASVSGNVLTLNAPWAGPALAAGTKVANYTSGGSFIYAINGILPPAAWTRYSGQMGAGIPNFTFRDGTAFAQPVVLMNFAGGATTQKVAGMQIIRVF